MISAIHNSPDSISVPVILISFVAFIFPFVNIMYVFFPINLMGKNLWLIAQMLIMLSLYLSTLFRWKEIITFQPSDLALLVIAIVGGLTLFSRELLYTEQSSFLGSRYIFSSIIFLLVFKKFVHGEKNIKLLQRVVIATCVLQAILGVLHAHLFPEINIAINPDNAKSIEFVFDAERTREGGTLGPSIFANTIVCGMYLLTTINPGKIPFRATILIIISMLIMFYAVLLSGSRYPIAVAGTLALVLFLRFFSNWRQAVGLLFVFSVLVFLFFFNIGGIEFLGIIRINEGSGGRLDKLLLPLQLLSENVMHLFVGPSLDEINNAVSSENIGISDNSYMQVALQFGLFLAVGFFVLLIRLLKRNVVDKRSLFFMIYILIGLGLTNCILWEPWVFFAMLVSTILSHGSVTWLPIVRPHRGSLYQTFHE